MLEVSAGVRSRHLCFVVLKRTMLSADYTPSITF